MMARIRRRAYDPRKEAQADPKYGGRRVRAMSGSKRKAKKAKKG